MVFVVVSLAVALIAGLAAPFGERLQATGLWAGKALVTAEEKDALPRGIQDALADGWPSTVGLVVPLLPFVAAIVGFFYAWWFAFVAFFGAGLLSVLWGKTRFVPRTVDWYLTILAQHAQRRQADYQKSNDALRADAAEHIANVVQELRLLYLGTGIPAPTMEQAQAAPHGQEEYLLDLLSSSTQ